MPTTTEQRIQWQEIVRQGTAPRSRIFAQVKRSCSIRPPELESDDIKVRIQQEAEVDRLIAEGIDEALQFSRNIPEVSGFPNEVAWAREPKLEEPTLLLGHESEKSPPGIGPREKTLLRTTCDDVLCFDKELPRQGDTVVGLTGQQIAEPDKPFQHNGSHSEESQVLEEPQLIESDLLRDGLWALDELERTKGFPDYPGDYVAILNRRVVGDGDDETELRERLAREHGVCPDRFVVEYKGPWM